MEKYYVASKCLQTGTVLPCGRSPLFNTRALHTHPTASPRPPVASALPAPSASQRAARPCPGVAAHGLCSARPSGAGAEEPGAGQGESVLVPSVLWPGPTNQTDKGQTQQEKDVF